MNKKVALAGRIAAVVLLLALAVLEIFGLITIIRYRRATSICEQERAIPRVDVNTGGVEIASTEDYVSCTVSVSGTEISEYTAGIRGRGNTTWEYFPKKPYRIKFTEKVSLFGEQENKSWVLLAMSNDFSVVKDRLAFTMADAIGTDAFVPSYNYVELYLNGKYNGLYLMTDQVDENKGRADVKESFSETDTEVPFLVELDAYASEEGVEGVDWFTVAGKAYAIKYPDAAERYTEAQFEYIKNYIEAVNDACFRGSVEELGALVDIDSFIDYFIIQETMGQPEINWKSVYMYKSADGLMKMGPVWDFDWSVTGPSTGKEKNMYRDDVSGLRSCENWFDMILKGSAEFKALVSERFDEVKGIMLAAIAAVRADEARISVYAERNHIRWNWYRTLSSYSDYYEEVLKWCESRIEWLDAEF